MPTNGDMTSEYAISGTDDSGQAYALTQSKTTSSCTRVSKWRTPVPTGSDTLILTISDTATGNAFAATGFVKAAFFNQDATNFVTIGYTDTGAESAYFKIPTGDFHVLNSPDIETNATGGAWTGYNTIDVVTARADTAACDLDVVIYNT
jgi:hypothetical protein|tara:strand:- start:7518 stop:7964 length:447 start_codon:yes stop_codon:yes gene_type:complete